MRCDGAANSQNAQTLNQLSCAQGVLTGRPSLVDTMQEYSILRRQIDIISIYGYMYKKVPF